VPAEVPTKPGKVTDAIDANAAGIFETQFLSCNRDKLLVSLLLLQPFDSYALRFLGICRDYTPDREKSFYRLIPFHRDVKTFPLQSHLVAFLAHELINYQSDEEFQGITRASDLADVFVAASSPLPLSSEAKERGKLPEDTLPRVALVPHLPWATIMSSLRDFSLVAQRKLRGL
jgi:hypothetical protein